jgi:hypothetical protein
MVTITPRPLYPRGKSPPGTHWIAGCMGPRNGMDDVEKRKFMTLQRLEPRSLRRPARSQSLYRLRLYSKYMKAKVDKNLQHVVAYRSSAVRMFLESAVVLYFSTRWIQSHELLSQHPPGNSQSSLFLHSCTPF